MHSTTPESQLLRTVHLHLKETGQSFGDSHVHILDRGDRWFSIGVKETIYVKLEQPSHNRGGGLRHHFTRHIQNSPDIPPQTQKQMMCAM